MRCRGQACSAPTCFERSKASRSRSGFTLFELLLVCAVVIVLGAMIAPSINGMYSNYRAAASADQVRAAWAEARTHAMNEGRPYRFCVKPNTGEFRVAPDASPYWAGNDSLQADDDPNNPPLIKEDTLPKPKVFTFKTDDQAPLDPIASAAGQTSSVGRSDGVWTTIAIFLPDGTAQDDVKSLELGETGTKPTILRLRALTGVVTIRAPIDEAKGK
jgi:type II secretory pathway pseudopilin PulG